MLVSGTWGGIRCLSALHPGLSWFAHQFSQALPGGGGASRGICASLALPLVRSRPPPPIRRPSAPLPPLAQVLPLPALPPAAKQVPAFVGGGTTDLVVDWPAVEETAAWFGVQPAKWEDTAHDAMLDTVGVRARQRLPGSALMLLGSACSWWSMLCGRAAVG